MRELTGKPKTNVGYENLNTNEVHLATIYTLDDIGDGVTYSRVLTTDITAGHIKLTEVVGTLDDVDEGATYGKVLLSHLSAGKLLLSSAAVKTGKWYNESGVEIDATSGIAIYGTNMAFITAKSSTAITAFADAGGGLVTVTSASHGLIAGDRVHITGTTNYNGNYVIAYLGVNTFNITATWVANDATGLARRIETYMGTDGAIYAGAGAIKLDASGILLKGAVSIWQSSLNDTRLFLNTGSQITKDKDGNEIPWWGVGLGQLWVGGAWAGQTINAFGFQHWYDATEIDPFSDTAKTVYFITKNKARDANLDHVFAPSVTSHGRLGNATYKWLSAHIDTITPETIDFPTTDVTDCLDEDDMASDSATKLATQQSIKAYADNTHRRITENYHSFWFNSHWFSGLLYEGWKTGSGLVSWDTNGAYVLQDTGATLNSYIRIVKENGANIYPNQWGASIIEFFWKGYFDSTTNQKIHIVLGHINDPTSSDNKVHHIGFKILDGILYGTVGDGANVTEATLQIDAAISASTVYTLRCKYTPTGVAEVRFWWMKGTDSAWTDAGTITTSLPSGGPYAEKMFNSSIYNTNAVSHKLYTNEVKSFVQGLYTGG